MAVLPENADFQMSLESAKKPTYTFIIDWSARQISGMDSGLAAMRQAAEIILQNERFRWQIYSSDFGSELKNMTILSARSPGGSKRHFLQIKDFCRQKILYFQNLEKIT